MTSGGYGWGVRKSLALAMVKPELASAGAEPDVTVLGETRRALVTPDSQLDPVHARLRA